MPSGSRRVGISVQHSGLRNLRHLFSWLAVDHGHALSYAVALVRYAPVRVRPSTLAADFIRDLLSATGGRRARTFEDARGHAMIRALTEGVRRAELVQVRLNDLPADLIARPSIRVIPLKGGRAAEEGRIVPLTLATAKAIGDVLAGTAVARAGSDLAGDVAGPSTASRRPAPARTRCSSDGPSGTRRLASAST